MQHQAFSQALQNGFSKELSEINASERVWRSKCAKSGLATIELTTQQLLFLYYGGDISPSMAAAVATLIRSLHFDCNNKDTTS